MDKQEAIKEIFEKYSDIKRIYFNKMENRMLDGIREGYNAGYSKGYEAGKIGMSTEVDAAYRHGYEDGSKQCGAYQRGYDEGYLAGRKEGPLNTIDKQSFSQGRNTGITIGMLGCISYLKEHGYNDAAEGLERIQLMF